jgi:hypothetical protein
VNYAISVALLILSAVSTLAAFGGRTWVEGDAPLLARVTRRGWVSLAALLAAFSLGTLREVTNAQAATKAAARAAEEKKRNDTSIMLLLSKDTSVSELAVELPTPGRPSSATESPRWKTIFPSVPPALADLVWLQGDVYPSVYGYDSSDYIWEDHGALLQTEGTYVERPPPGRPGMDRSRESMRSSYRVEIAGRDANSIRFTRQFALNERGSKPSILFRDLSGSQPVAMLRLRLVGRYASEAERQALLKRHADLVVSALQPRPGEIHFRIPKSLQDAARRDWTHVRQPTFRAWLTGDTELLMSTTCRIQVYASDEDVVIVALPVGGPDLQEQSTTLPMDAFGL